MSQVSTFNLDLSASPILEKLHDGLNSLRSEKLDLASTLRDQLGKLYQKLTKTVLITRRCSKPYLEMDTWSWPHCSY